MRYEIKNMFAPEVTEVDLSEKELDYITAIAANVTRKRALQAIQLKAQDIKDLYLKFGLTDSTDSHPYVQMTVLAVTNNLINKNKCFEVASKYGFTECSELGEKIKKRE